MMLDSVEDFQEKSLGLYKCDDSSQLSIRVTVKSKFAIEIEEETTVIAWQQKLYSPAELDVYSKLTIQQTSPLEKQFKEEVVKLLAGGQHQTRRISTHIHAEENVNMAEINKEVLIPHPPLSRLAKTYGLQRFRRQSPASDPVTTVSADDDPTVEALQADVKRLALSDVETFILIITIEGKECVLCRMELSSSGSLSVWPDFNADGFPYRLQSAEGQRGMCDYWLQWIKPETNVTQSSCSQSNQTIRRNAGASSSVNSVGAQSKTPLASQLRLPPLGTRLVVFYGEIMSAQGFEYDNLFVHYLLELPSGWRASDNTRLSGLTQLCRANPAAHFGFPIAGELLQGSPDDQQTTSFEPAAVRWPTLFMQVMSEDRMGVTRVEGYCHVTLPRASGSGAAPWSLRAWRPHTGTTARLQRYFVGGSPELDDPSYVAVPSAHDGSKLSRHGFSTVSSGWLHVRIDSIQQGGIEAGSGWDKGGATGHQAQLTAVGVASVLKAFSRARARMLQAKEAVALTTGCNFIAMTTAGETEA